jgi:PKD repeat protein
VTQFNDASTGNIKSRQWKIQNSTFNNTSPTYIFKTPATYPVTLTVSGNNNCISQVSKNIAVPVPPVIDFTTLYPCTGSPAQFQEVNPGGSDPAIAWNWSFTSGSGSGNPVNYTFPSSGLYTVTLNSTRQSNCVYSVSKNISIIDGPVASFTPSVSAGAAPLNVIFSNGSILADTYSWNFGDANNSTSSDLSPAFTFGQLGSYNVKLIASNAFNCSSTATALINVVIPNIDAALNSFVLANDPTTSSKRAVVTIANKSNIPLVNPVVSVNLGGSASLRETVPVIIQVGGFLSRTLNMQIVPTQINYVCAILEVPNDLFEGNNEQCVSITNDEVVLPPYPNPATSHFTLEWINPSAQNVHVRIFKTNGQLSFDQTINAPEGLTQYEVDASSWANGLYVVQITGATSQKQYKLVIAN